MWSTAFALPKLGIYTAPEISTKYDKYPRFSDVQVLWISKDGIQKILNPYGAENLHKKDWIHYDHIWIIVLLVITIWMCTCTQCIIFCATSLTSEMAFLTLTRLFNVSDHIHFFCIYWMIVDGIWRLWSNSVKSTQTFSFKQVLIHHHFHSQFLKSSCKCKSFQELQQIEPKSTTMNKLSTKYQQLHLWTTIVTGVLRKCQLWLWRVATTPESHDNQRCHAAGKTCLGEMVTLIKSHHLRYYRFNMYI